ncbi:MAG TPA: RNA 2',3'-cyclic phosphodiesterase [Longimicrobiaceae bacterium]|nr:RNA 2',3'-cyclic phosphodiesterase [Longimicrobiaceae bacterium]
MSPSDNQRLFVGVPLPEAVRVELIAYLETALGGRLPGRAVPARNWHLTLRFLGATDAGRRAGLVDGLRGIRADAFDLSFGGLGAFPRPARAAVLWVGVDRGASELRALAAGIEEAARRVGFKPEEKAFSPHLTLSRLHPPADVRREIASAAPFAGSMRVEAFSLFRSHLGGGPARYEELERLALAARG